MSTYPVALALYAKGERETEREKQRKSDGHNTKV